MIILDEGNGQDFPNDIFINPSLNNSRILVSFLVFRWIWLFIGTYKIYTKHGVYSFELLPLEQVKHLHKCCLYDILYHWSVFQRHCDVNSAQVFVNSLIVLHRLTSVKWTNKDQWINKSINQSISLSHPSMPYRTAKPLLIQPVSKSLTQPLQQHNQVYPI